MVSIGKGLIPPSCFDAMGDLQNPIHFIKGFWYKWLKKTWFMAYGRYNCTICLAIFGGDIP